jgi:predicted nucleotidyltransferase component of viral defense system
MISHQEVMELAREFGLSPQVIEKDYVLGWLLAGITAHPELAPNWVFKGGTCLKKCYFETYRFSEDLDFTLTNPAHLNQEFLQTTFAEVAGWVYEQTGIEIPGDTIRFDFYKNPRGKVSVQGRVGYRGPMLRRGDAPRVKLDLTADELLVLEPSIREVNHPFSDRPDEGILVRCYAFEEVFAEKVRALAERTRPRDLYDVIHLYRHDELCPDQPLVMQTLQEKCAFKGIAVPVMATVDVEPARSEIVADWEQMLAHQLPALPSFERFWQELPKLFAWLHGSVARPVLPAISTYGGGRLDEEWRPPPMAQAWGSTAPLEIIRFAAANRLCVALDYQGSRRVIEPYSLRKSHDGNLLLYAISQDNGENRCYRIDRIQGATATDIGFIPSYTVELTSVGPVSAPPVKTGSGAARQSSPTVFSHAGAPRRSSASHYGPKYVYECGYCGRKFTRKTQNSTMRAHKDKSGYPCSGRIGYLVDTKY